MIRKLDKFDFLYHNEYYYLYVDLILENQSRTKIRDKTQRHHIVPKHVFNKQSLATDNSKENLVDLLYKDHVLAHAYLFLCAKPLYRYANCIALNIICNNNFSLQQLFEKLPSIQCQYESTMKNHTNSMFLPDVYEKHKATMQTEVVRNAISESIKAVRKKQSNYININKDRECKRVSPLELPTFLSQGWQQGAPKGKVRMHNFKHETTVWPEQVEEYLKQGWLEGSNPNRKVPVKRLPDKDGNIKRNKTERRTTETRDKQRQKLLSYYENNIDARRKSSYPVALEHDGERLDFLSVFECGEYLGLTSAQIASGLVGEYIKYGYIKNKKSPFYMWKINKILNKGE